MWLLSFVAFGHQIIFPWKFLLWSHWINSRSCCLLWNFSLVWAIKVVHLLRISRLTVQTVFLIPCQMWVSFKHNMDILIFHPLREWECYSLVIVSLKTKMTFAWYSIPDNTHTISLQCADFEGRIDLWGKKSPSKLLIIGNIFWSIQEFCQAGEYMRISINLFNSFL